MVALAGTSMAPKTTPWSSPGELLGREHVERHDEEREDDPDRVDRGARPQRRVERAV
jgi:hypothetical protein